MFSCVVRRAWVAMPGQKWPLLRPRPAATLPQTALRAPFNRGTPSRCHHGFSSSSGGGGGSINITRVRPHIHPGPRIQPRQQQAHTWAQVPESRVQASTRRRGHGRAVRQLTLKTAHRRSLQHQQHQRHHQQSQRWPRLPGRRLMNYHTLMRPHHSHLRVSGGRLRRHRLLRFQNGRRRLTSCGRHTRCSAGSGPGATSHRNASISSTIQPHRLVWLGRRWQHARRPLLSRRVPYTRELPRLQQQALALPLQIPRAGLRVLIGAAVLGLLTFAALYPFAWGNSWWDAPGVFYTALKRNLADFVCVFRMVYHYRKELGSLPEDMDPEERARRVHECHVKCAGLLRDLFCNNAGIYIKLGQHLAVLDYVIPKEYVDTMQCMFDKAPTSTLEEVFEVIERDLGKPAEELFQHFDTTPIASASLAQVHRAVTHDGQKVAVKVQHMGLREESRGDVATVRLLVDIVRFFFPSYDYSWLIEEVQRNLPLEMDFVHEGQNADACRAMFAHRRDVDVPGIRWDLSNTRVLTMDFAEGCSLSDVEGLRQSGLNLNTVSRIVTELFSEQIFLHGLVHCDPHPGNLLVRTGDNGSPVVVLLDHGLYRQLDEDFRDLYCRLWRSLIRGDADDIKMYAERMNAGEFYFIFAAMLTYKGWDEVIGGTATARLELSGSEDEKEVARSSVAKYFREINALLARIPRDVLLLLKTNDCLHGLENKLRQADARIMPGLTHATMARYCLQGIRILPTYTNFFSVRRDMTVLELKLFAMWLAFLMHETLGINPLRAFLPS